MNAAKWIETTVSRPDGNQYTPEQFRLLFGLSEDVVDQLVRDNFIPPPTRFNSRSVFFTWKHAAMLLMRMEMGLNLPQSSEKPTK